jgi:hypothetical protein
MRFEITTDDLDKTEKLLEDFIKMAETEYTKKMENARNKLKNLPSVLINKQMIISMTEMPLILSFVREKERITFFTGTKKPKFLGGKQVKKMEENLRLFLWSMGVTGVKVKFVGN